ncbi:MAG: D-glycero-beta-D-manno-heptose-7-phosphate kinase [Candidatus Omnitrophota bacterium]|nr:D-glycero-beta-D-manno-heptose-7-phosphate kinase [Candidatus Omnitrophota bacterium]
MDAKRFKRIISKFNRAKVLVIGDFMLDEFIWGEVSRISPEAPVPVVKVNSKSFMPGGALNVVNNISMLGGRVFPCGVIGRDRNGKKLIGYLKERGTDTKGVFSTCQRPTTSKTRIVARHQQVVRVDTEDENPVDLKLINRIIAFVRDRIVSVDIILIEDYGKGIITPRLLLEVLSIARRHKKIIAVDPKGDNFSYYKGVTIITPNHHEAQAVTGIKLSGENALERTGKKLLNELKVQAVLITLGEAGMCLFESSGKITHIPTKAQEVFDVSGAGDTVIASVGLALASGATMQEAAAISNYAAGIVVGKLGIATVTQDELLKSIVQGAKQEEIHRNKKKLKEDFH